jgi:hypothetical protein
MTRLHAMIGEQLGDDAEAEEVRVGIETIRAAVIPGVPAVLLANHGG